MMQSRIKHLLVATFLTFLLLVFSILVLTGCDQNLNNNENNHDKRIQVSLNLKGNESPKSLIVTTDMEVARYTYEATPLFEVENGEIEGATTEEKEFVEGENVGWFVQGYWSFYVRGYAADNSLVWEGENPRVLLDIRHTNIVVEVNHTLQGTGSINYTISSVRISENLKASISYLVDGDYTEPQIHNATVSETNENNVKFTATHTRPSGTFQARVALIDDTTEIGGAIIGGYVTKDGTTEVTGELVANTWSYSAFEIEMPGSVNITIQGESKPHFVPLQNTLTETYTYNSEEGDIVTWYLNGEEIGHDTSIELEFTTNEIGVYSLSLEVNRDGEIGFTNKMILVDQAKGLRVYDNICGVASENSNPFLIEYYGILNNYEYFPQETDVIQIMVYKETPIIDDYGEWIYSDEEVIVKQYVLLEKTANGYKTEIELKNGDLITIYFENGEFTVDAHGSENADYYWYDICIYRDEWEATGLNKYILCDGSVLYLTSNNHLDSKHFMDIANGNFDSYYIYFSYMDYDDWHLRELEEPIRFYEDENVYTTSTTEDGCVYTFNFHTDGTMTIDVDTQNCLNNERKEYCFYFLVLREVPW